MIAERDDEDFVRATNVLIASVFRILDEESAMADAADVYFNHDQTMIALQALTNDGFLTDKVSIDDPSGYGIWKDSTSPTGVSLDDLADNRTSHAQNCQFYNGTLSAACSPRTPGHQGARRTLESRAF
jgi:hypothetical protein